MIQTIVQGLCHFFVDHHLANDRSRDRNIM